MHTHIELLDRFMSGKTSPEEERTLLAWFRDPDHKEEIMAFYKSRWEESSGKKLPPKLQGQMFCEIKKRMRQEKKTLEIKKKPHTLWKWLSYAAVALICIGLGIGSHWYNMRQVPPPDPLDYVVLPASVCCMSIFFSVHYLTIYYLLQPYTAGTEMKSAVYQIVLSLTYVACYGVMQVKIPPLAFGALCGGFCVLYCAAACLLVYRLAPKTFRLRT